MQEAEQERWLTLQANLGLAPNTLVAYRRAVEEYATFCARRHLEVRTATREHVALYVRDLAVRPVAAKVRFIYTIAGTKKAWRTAKGAVSGEDQIGQKKMLGISRHTLQRYVKREN